MKHFILSVDEINKQQMENEAYKQSEQEASEIIAELKHTLDCKNGTIETLKAENERLKSEIKNNKSAYEVELGTYNMECGNLLEENKELAHYLACMTEQRNKANTILQEIKEIAERRFVSCSDTYCDEQIKTKECNPKEPCNAYLLRQILQLTKAEEE